MLAKFYVTKLLIAALLIAHCDSESDEEFMKKIQARYDALLARTKLFKPARCLDPGLCGGSRYLPIPGFEVVRWFFEAGAKVCQPVYMPPGRKMCDVVARFPKTKKECEDLCGETCVVTYANRKTEPGVCMARSSCHIPIARGVPNPCGWDHVRCCPRNYVMPITTPVPTTPDPITFRYPMQAIILSVNTNRQNQSSVYNNFTVDSSTP